MSRSIPSLATTLANILVMPLREIIGGRGDGGGGSLGMVALGAAACRTASRLTGPHTAVLILGAKPHMRSRSSWGFSRARFAERLRVPTAYLVRGGGRGDEPGGQSSRPCSRA